MRTKSSSARKPLVLFQLENPAGGLVLAFVSWCISEHFPAELGMGLGPGDGGRAEFGMCCWRQAGGLPGAVVSIPHVSEPAPPAGIHKFGQKHPNVKGFGWKMLPGRAGLGAAALPVLLCFQRVPVQGLHPALLTWPQQCQEPSTDSLLFYS